jgi:perosamine synthetase
LNEQTLALFGGKPAVRTGTGDVFTWPVVTPAMEQAVLDVLRAGQISGFEITERFEEEYARWLGVKYALACNNGTAAVHSALFGLGIGRGDQIICPAMTFWASCLPVYSLGGSVVFADIDPETLCLDPADIERRITDATRAVVAVHYAGRPAPMDEILAVARRHGLAVLEDASHAHGSVYKGRLTGTLGDAAAFSLMSGKSFPIGEGGMLVTGDRRVYERAVAFAHYARHEACLTLPDLKAGSGLPWGGYKYRLNQLCSAIGRVQLVLYPEQMAEIDRSMNMFWDLLEDVPGLRSQRPPRGSGTTMGGWYNPKGLYRREELGGLSVTRFCEAVRAEGVPACTPGCNRALHTHPLFRDLDVYGAGRPTRLAHSADTAALPQEPGTLPCAEAVQGSVFAVPWFRKYRPGIIAEHAAAYRKAALNYRALLAGDPGDPESAGEWGASSLKHDR